jgi:leucyl aminopeptidase (aminopeptidase T)
MDNKLARHAARNVLGRIGCVPGEAVLIVFDEAKRDLALILDEEARTIQADPYLLQLPVAAQKRFAPWFTRFLEEMAAHEPTIVLVSHDMVRSQGLLEAIGRPDQQVKIHAARFFCDWALPGASFARVYSADPGEVARYRDALLARLGTGGEIHVTTALGTDITFQARDWRDHGNEILTAPVEGTAEGVVLYDASVFWGPPDSPIRAAFEKGRVVSAECVGVVAGQLSHWLAHSQADEGAAELAELGLGINPNAELYGDVMESEMAQGTCHLDLGNNLPFGGQNASRVHYGGVIALPTITVDGRVVMERGN